MDFGRVLDFLCDRAPHSYEAVVCCEKNVTLKSLKLCRQILVLDIYGERCQDCRSSVLISGPALHAVRQVTAFAFNGCPALTYQTFSCSI